MQTVTLEEAQSNLSELLNKASQGEEIAITEAGVPRARIVALPQGSINQTRRIGFLQGDPTAPPGRYELPETDDELIALFEGTA